ncbi:MAG: GTPase Era [Dissulfuribacterales bacterium]
MTNTLQNMQCSRTVGGFRSGFAAIIGAPNVGKSTLLNKLLGTKVAITTPKPQTTRRLVRGILTTERYQVVFVDTPGIHDSKRLLNQAMVRWARQAMIDIDVVLFMVDAAKRSPDNELFILDMLRRTETPVTLLLNKIDLIPKDSLLPLIEEMQRLFAFASIIPISARFNDGVKLLLDDILRFIPEGPLFYDAEAISDQTKDMLAAELVREKIFLLTHEDIPYSTTVEVEDFKEDRQKQQVSIHATIYVEKDSQKGIILGANASMIKKIKKMVREELEASWGMRITLELWVKVRKNWSRDERFLKQVGLLE